MTWCVSPFDIALVLALDCYDLIAFVVGIWQVLLRGRFLTVFIILISLLIVAAVFDSDHDAGDDDYTRDHYYYNYDSCSHLFLYEAIAVAPIVVV